MQSDTLHLSDIIRDPIAIGFKKFTANQIIEYAQKSVHESRADWMLDKFKFNAAKHKGNSFYQVWTHDNHSEELLSTKFIEQKFNYIHQNPVRAGIVQYDYEYLYSSARNYANLTNEMEIDFV